MERKLRPTIIGGDNLGNDFVVLFEGRSIGRIRQAEERVGHNPGWDWAINPPLPIPPWGNGSADSLEQAKAAFRAAWERFYATLTRPLAPPSGCGETLALANLDHTPILINERLTMFWKETLLATTIRAWKGVCYSTTSLLFSTSSAAGRAPKTSLLALNREPTATNRVAISKALKRLWERGLIDMKTPEVYNVGKSNLYRARRRR